MSGKEAQIVEIITGIVPTISIGDDQYAANLFELGLDSLDHASVLLAVEEEFGCTIDDSAVEGLISINAISSYVEDK